jgi:galactose-1-phosphate uridylyltransferase
MRSLLGKLDELVEEEQELIIKRNKKAATFLPYNHKIPSYPKVMK